MTEQPSPEDSGSRRAWVRAALEEHERPLVAYARQLSGDLERARDAVQETFTRLCTADRASIEPRLRAWLFHVCRNQLIDMQRVEGRMRGITDEESREATSQAPAPGAALEREEQLGSVLASVGKLPDPQQEVLLLKFRHGLRYREIAEVTGKSVSHVGVLIHKGLAALRAEFASEIREGRAS